MLSQQEALAPLLLSHAAGGDLKARQPSEFVESVLASVLFVVICGGSSVQQFFTLLYT